MLHIISNEIFRLKENFPLHYKRYNVGLVIIKNENDDNPVD